MALRVNNLASTEQAVAYFTHELERGDYYAGDSRTLGTYHGDGARMLGIEGRRVDEASFRNLMGGRDPETGEKLTQRFRPNRRAGYDLTFSAPKGVGVLASYMEARHGDTTIRDLIRESALETVRDLERNDVQTRVRKGRFWNTDESRCTSNLVAAEFYHEAARPVGGIPSPHPHYHFVIANLTHDETESRWKAIEAGRSFHVNADRLEASFEARLAMKLREAGWEIEPTTRTSPAGRDIRGWDLKGLDPSIVDTYSLRQRQIYETAERRGLAADPKTLDGIAARHRAAKKPGLDLEAARRAWFGKDGMASEDQRANLEYLAKKQGGSNGPESPSPAAEHVDYALGFLLENNSITTQNRLMSVALRKGVGMTSPEAIRVEIDRRDDLLRREHNGVVKLTHRGVFEEEQRLFALARQRLGAYKPFSEEAPPLGPMRARDGTTFELARDQKRAIRHALTVGSRSWVQMIEGDAGTGKTTVATEIAGGIRKATGKGPIFLAPTNAAVEVLRRDGFKEARTVHSFLRDKDAREKARGSVLYVDECGLLSVRDGANLLRAAEASGARNVILSGDHKQHHAVERGDFARLLRDSVPSLPVSRLGTIQRQRSNEEYREAASLAAGGRTDEALDRLEAMNAVKQVRAAKSRYKHVAASVVASARRGEDVLVVSPTHAEAARATHCIRRALRDDGRLGSKETEFYRLVARNLTGAEKTDPKQYRPGDVVEFHVRCKGGFFKGDRLIATGRADEEGRPLARRGIGGRVVPIPTDRAAKFDLYRSQALPVARGEKLRITKTSSLSDGRTLNANTVVTAKSVTKHGHLELEDGRILPKNFAHLAPGYVSTSHSSQGKTVDKVIIAQGAESAAASSRNQFYVSMTRARSKIEVYTDDKEKLRQAVRRPAERMSATELMIRGKPFRPSPVTNDEMLGRRGRIARIAEIARERIAEHVAERAGAVTRHAQQIRANLGRFRSSIPERNGPEFSR